MKPAARVATFFLVVVAALHALRLVFRTEVTVGAFIVPMWASAVALLGLSALAVWLWREQHE